MSQINDNQVTALFAALNAPYSASAANTGDGLQGEWPPEGISDHLLKNVTFKPDEGKNSDGSKYPLLAVQFEFEEIPGADPSRDPTKPPLQWKGEQFRLTPNYEKVVTGNNAANIHTAIRIGEERFKGHCSKILKKAPEACTNIGNDLQEILNAIAAGNVALQVKIQHREAAAKPKPGQAANPSAKPRLYKTEFIVDNIGG